MGDNAGLYLGLRDAVDSAAELQDIQSDEMYVGPDGYLKRKLPDGNLEFLKIKPLEDTQKDLISIDSSEVGAVPIVVSKDPDTGELTIATKDISYSTPADDRLALTPGGAPGVMVVEALSVEGTVRYVVRLRTIAELLGVDPVNKAGDTMTGELVVPGIDVGS